MTVLVTGATGFFGAHLVRSLARLLAPATIHATDLGSAPDAAITAYWAGAPVTYQSLDVTDRDAVRTLIAAVRPEAVVHAAALTPGGEQETSEARAIARVNAEGSFVMLDCATACPSVRRIVAVSSAAVLGPNSGTSPLDETAPADPRSLYGASKLVVETLASRLAAERDRSIVSIRVASLYGAMERSRATRPRTSLIHRLVSAGAEVKVAGPDVLRDYVHADDAAGAVARIFQVARPEPLYHLGGGEPVGWHRLLDAAQAAGVRLRRVARADHADISLDAGDARPILCIDRARRDLDFAPRSIEAGLRDLVAERAAVR